MPSRPKKRVRPYRASERMLKRLAGCLRAGPPQLAVPRFRKQRRFHCSKVIDHGDATPTLVTQNLRDGVDLVGVLA